MAKQRRTRAKKSMTRAEKQAFHYGCICGASNAKQSARTRTRARARRRSW